MDYFNSDRIAEDGRLLAQGRLFDPLTRRLLEMVGLARGMRVLDLGRWASPQPTLWGQVREWLLETAEKAAINTRLGPELFSLYREAGLPGPRLLCDSVAAGGPDAPAWGWANVVSAAVPLMEKLGVTSRAEVDPPTLASRLLAEVTQCDGCVIAPPLTGAWTVRP